MAKLATNIVDGQPGHAAIHNEEREAHNLNDDAIVAAKARADDAHSLASSKYTKDPGGIPPADMTPAAADVLTRGTRYDSTTKKLLASDGTAIDTVGTLVGSVPFSQPGSATVGKSGSFRMPAAGTLQIASLTATGAPAGSALSVDVLHNDVAISTLTIAAGTTTAAEVALNVAHAAGDLIAANATSVGSTTAATGVVLQVDYVLSQSA